MTMAGSCFVFINTKVSFIFSKQCRQYWHF